MKKILVIDDQEFIRKNISRILRNHGYSVLEAGNGAEGTKIIGRERIDLLITDIVMPQKSGVELLIDLREDLENIKIIVITGKVSPEASAFRNLVEKFGVSAILYKPFKKETLIKTVDELLASSR